MMSNNALIRLACLAGVPWLDWRLTCHANVGPTHPREPSVRGGAPTSPGRSMLACVCLSGCVIVRDARRWEATWACSRLIMGHASWLRYCSPMASMMTAASTVRTMMTPWRVGATHPHVSAGRRGDPGAEGTCMMKEDRTPRGCGARSRMVHPHDHRLIFARMHPLRKRSRARSSGMSLSRCPCLPVSHNYHSLCYNIINNKFL
jgi:hypothetical protein